MPEDTTLVGYADDVAVLITARNVELAQLKLNQVMRRVGEWMSAHGLQLALPKTEVVLLTGRRIETVIALKVGDTDIMSKPAVKYLGITLDTKLNFGEHIRKACNKASAVMVSLSRLMANVGGPTPNKRRLLMKTVEAVLLYGAEIWGDVTKMRKYCKRLAAIQRLRLLRVSSAYRTVSEPAVMAVAGAIPIDLLAQERKRVFERPGDESKEEAALRVRDEVVREWQRRWSGDPRGRWTARIIPQVRIWMERGHGEVDFFVTQLLTGHGFFRKYLFRMGKVASPLCKFCPNVEDDAEHTFFSCTHFTEEREALTKETGVLTPENIVVAMVRTPENWERIRTFATRVLLKKKADGALQG